MTSEDVMVVDTDEDEDDVFVEALTSYDIAVHSHCESCITPKKCLSSGANQGYCSVIRCDSGAGKCVAVFHRCKLDEHKQLCEYALVNCLNHDSGCSLILQRRLISSHLSHCPASVVQCSVEWNRWRGRQALRMNQPLPKALQHGQLDLALALRDQRFLDASLKIPIQTKKALRNAQNRVHPAVPICMPIHLDTDGSTISASTSKTTASDDSYSPWNEAEHPPGLASSVCDKLQMDRKEDINTIDEEDELEVDMSSCKSERKNIILGKQDKGDESNVNMEDVEVGKKRNGTVFTSFINMNIYAGSSGGCSPGSASSGSNTNLEDDGISSANGVDVQLVSTRQPQISKEEFVLNPALIRHLSSTIDEASIAAAVAAGACYMCAQSEFGRQEGLTYENGLCYGHGGCNRAKDYNNPVMDKQLGDNDDEYAMQSSDKECSVEQSTSEIEADSRLTLGLDLTIEAVTRYRTKPRSMITFLCAQTFRRDEYCWHYKNVHSDIHGGLNGWIEQRCPLYSYGCPFSSVRFTPVTKEGCVLHNDILESFTILPCLSEETYVGPDYISSLPVELLALIAGKYLDASSLNNLSMVNHLFRFVCESLLESRGMVVWEWERTKLPENEKISWQRTRKRWSFSTNFSEVRQWHMDTDHAGRVSRHLLECPYNKVVHHTTPFTYIPETGLPKRLANKQDNMI